jgi:hypothetical protein
MSEKKKVWEKMSKADLIYELGRYDKKIKDQAEEIRFRNKQIREMEGGVKEMSVLVDSVISRVIDKYGCYGYGGEFIAIPAVIPQHSDSVQVAMSAGGLHILIRRKREEN